MYEWSEWTKENPHLKHCTLGDYIAVVEKVDPVLENNYTYFRWGVVHKGVGIAFGFTRGIAYATSLCEWVITYEGAR